MKPRKLIFKNERTAASAGSGKTYALVKRFIALAAEETDPSCIIALTFTRKSAGEFLSKILTRLADAAASDDSAKKLSEELAEFSPDGEISFPRKDAENLLREFTRNLNRLHLGTIDSFFSSVLKSFAGEMNIFSPVSIMDSFRIASEKRRIIEQILRSKSVDSAAFAEFAETVRRASFGVEEKSVDKTLGRCIEESHKLFNEESRIDMWGDAETILGKPPMKWDESEYKDCVAALEKAVGGSSSDALFSGAVKFFRASNNNTVDIPNTVVERLADMYAEGALLPNSEISYRKKTYNIPPETALILRSLFTRLLHGHIARTCEAAKAAAQIAGAYEKIYDAELRRKGRMCFDDIPLVLNRNSEVSGRLIEYRLDAKFKHWLFDEFQDTSRLQWKFFEGLIDEVVFNSDGEKTFYYVGDVKQSLYSWRGGDRMLFDEVFGKYARAKEPNMRNCAELVTSWRSGKAVVEAVNSVFSDTQTLGRAFTESAAESFSEKFKPHVSAQEIEGGKKRKASVAQLRLTEKFPKNIRGEIKAECDEIFSIIKEIGRERLGSCAVLVGDNKTARIIVEELRARIVDAKLDINVAGELENNIAADNMALAAFLQILKAVAHPADTAASESVSMTPFAAFAEDFAETFRNKILKKIASRGFLAAAEDFEKFALENAVSDSPSFKTNLRRIREACRKFDESDASGIDAFIGFALEKKCRLTSAESSVQVMTIHKAKGLGFRTVILPDLHRIRERRGDGLRYILRSFCDETEKIGISYMPAKIIANLSPLLRESRAIAADNDNFENICRLYVALTRAEDALYIVMPKPPKYENDGEISPARLIFESFIPQIRKIEDPKERKEFFESQLENKIFNFGDARWFETSARHAENPARDEIPAIVLTPPEDGLERMPAPSATTAPAAINAEAAAFGTAVHAALEKTEFVFDPRESAERAVADAGIVSEIAASVRGVLERLFSDAATAPFFKKNPNEKVFREFSFDAVLGGRAVRGSIDRLALKLGEDGKFESAEIIDFKGGGNPTPERERQLSLYRNAVSKIFKMRIEKVSAKIISYSSLKVYESF